MKILEFIWGFIRWLAGRPRLAVRVIEDNVEEEAAGGLQFEVENRSSAVTSLEPLVKCTFYYLSKLHIRKGKNRYYVRESERRLEPFKPTVLTATPHNCPHAYNFSWFRTYVFRPTRGFRTKVRVRNALLEPLSRVQFIIEFLPFRFLGRVRAEGPMSIDDYEKMRRSRGPH